MQQQNKADECIEDLQLNGLKILQKKSGFRFGVDAVLLADFAKKQPSARTLDLCTGTGIVPLLLSAKNNVPVLAGLEIQPEVAEMAQRSVLLNGLEGRIKIQCGDLKEADNYFQKHSFDCVTCNPPYVKNGSGLQNGLSSKTIARHEIFCTLEDVIHTSANMLRPQGHLFLIHRPSRLADLICTLRAHRLEPKQMRFVSPMPDKAPNLVLIDAVWGGGAELNILPSLSVYDGNGNYTNEIQQIYCRENQGGNPI